MERRRNSEDVDNTPKFLAIATTLMVFGMTVLMMFVATPDKNEHIITQLITAMISAWGVATGVYFNTTKNSAKAQDTMNQQARALVAQVSPTPPSESSGKVELQPGDKVEVNAATGETP